MTQSKETDQSCLEAFREYLDKSGATVRPTQGSLAETMALAKWELERMDAMAKQFE